MDITKKKDAEIHLRTTTEVKDEFKLQAKKAGKTLSEYLEYLLNDSDNNTLNKNTYNTLDIDMSHLQIMSFVLTRLCMGILNITYDNPEEVKKFAKQALEEAEKYFKKNGSHFTLGL